MCLDSGYEIDDAGGEVVAPWMLLIDCGGHRTEEIYRFALTDPDRITPVRGQDSGRARHPIHFGRTKYESRIDGSRIETPLWTVNTDLYKNRLMSSIVGKDEHGEDLWLLNDGVDAHYLTQMASEHRVVERRKSGVQLVWRPVSAGVDNHYWDCEVLQQVAADVLQLDVPVASGPAQPDPHPEPDGADAGGRGGWIDAVAGKWRTTL